MPSQTINATDALITEPGYVVTPEGQLHDGNLYPELPKDHTRTVDGFMVLPVDGKKPVALKTVRIDSFKMTDRPQREPRMNRNRRHRLEARVRVEEAQLRVMQKAEAELEPMYEEQKALMEKRDQALAQLEKSYQEALTAGTDDLTPNERRYYHDRSVKRLKNNYGKKLGRLQMRMDKVTRRLSKSKKGKLMKKYLKEIESSYYNQRWADREIPTPERLREIAQGSKTRNDARRAQRLAERPVLQVMVKF